MRKKEYVSMELLIIFCEEDLVRTSGPNDDDGTLWEGGEGVGDDIFGD